MIRERGRSEWLDRRGGWERNAPHERLAGRGEVIRVVYDESAAAAEHGEAAEAEEGDRTGCRDDREASCVGVGEEEFDV